MKDKQIIGVIIILACLGLAVMAFNDQVDSRITVYEPKDGATYLSFPATRDNNPVILICLLGIIVGYFIGTDD